MSDSESSEHGSDDGVTGSSRKKLGVQNHRKYRRDKPWDHEGINHWELEEWKRDYMPGPLLEESSFATLFPKYREKYLRWVYICIHAFV